MNLFHVAPFDQNLSIGGRDLLDNEATLESLRIYPHSVILLKVSHITFDYSEPSLILCNSGGGGGGLKMTGRKTSNSLAGGPLAILQSRLCLRR
jgi:hypothetical protein